MIAFTRFELIRTLHNTKFVMFLIVMPVGFYLLFTNLHVDNTTQGRSPMEVMIAIATYAGTGSAMYATGPELAIERGSGWLRQLFSTPLRFGEWMTAKVVQALALALPGVLAVCLTAVAANAVRLDAAQWLLVVAAMLLAAVPFALLGHVVGLLFSNQSASASQVVVLFGLSFVGGVFVPISALPAGVRSVGRLTPSYHAITLGHDITASTTFPLGHLAAIAAASVLLAALTALLWRRDGATGR